MIVQDPELHVNIPNLILWYIVVAEYIITTVIFTQLCN